MDENYDFMIAGINKFFFTVSMLISIIGSMGLFGAFVILPIISGMQDGRVSGWVLFLAVIAVGALLICFVGLFSFGWRTIKRGA